MLNIQAERVTVVHPDTDVTPYDMATLGSRSTYHMGNAVRLAAEDARDKIAALARELGLPAGTNVPVAELFQKKYGMQAGNIIGVGSYIPAYAPPDHDTGQTPNVTPFWMIGATGAEIEVDTETGHVRVTRLVNVADVGRAINPRIVETQLSGAAIMQLGFTMQEKIELDDGQIINASLADYKIPSLLDIPPDIGQRGGRGRTAFRPVRRQGRRRERHLRGLAGDRQRHRRRGRRAADRAAADRRDALPRAARRGERSAGGVSVETPTRRAQSLYCAGWRGRWRNKAIAPYGGEMP